MWFEINTKRWNKNMNIYHGYAEGSKNDDSNDFAHFDSVV